MLQWSDLLIPGAVTGMFGLAAAALKVYEYRRQAHRLDFIMVVAVAARVGLGLIYLFMLDGPVTDRTVLIRLCLTLLLLVEVLRGLRKMVARKRVERTVANTLVDLGWPKDKRYD